MPSYFDDKNARLNTQSTHDALADVVGKSSHDRDFDFEVACRI